MVRIEEPGKHLSAAELDAFEKQARLQLPHEYRAFLLETNGGIPDPDIVEVHGAPGSPTDVQVLFGIARRVDSSDLLWNREEFSDRLEARLLPIACDSGGNLFCLSLSGNDSGSVLYVDLEQSAPVEYRVAETFGEFLAQLTYL